MYMCWYTCLCRYALEPQESIRWPLAIPALSFEACSLPEPGSCGFAVVCLFVCFSWPQQPFALTVLKLQACIRSRLTCYVGAGGSNAGTYGCTTNAFIY